jgi:hypothetical protein
VELHHRLNIVFLLLVEALVARFFRTGGARGC